jgi:hypothetical protein
MQSTQIANRAGSGDIATAPLLVPCSFPFTHKPSILTPVIVKFNVQGRSGFLRSKKRTGAAGERSVT